LKIDIEYSEWDALETMLATPSCLANVKQLTVEFHTREMNITVKGMSSRDDLARYWNVLRGINQLSFRVWNVWNNPFCNSVPVELPERPIAVASTRTCIF